MLAGFLADWWMQIVCGILLIALIIFFVQYRKRQM